MRLHVGWAIINRVPYYLSSMMGAVGLKIDVYSFSTINSCIHTCVQVDQTRVRLTIYGMYILWRMRCRVIIIIDTGHHCLPRSLTYFQADDSGFFSTLRGYMVSCRSNKMTGSLLIGARW